MNTGLLPLFDACLPDGDAAVSAACGALMQPVCSGAYSDEDGNMRSLLLDPQSNCRAWMTAIQVATAGGVSLSSNANLDAAMNTYCLGQGSLSDECSCIAFPITAQAWCAQTPQVCPAYAVEQCAATEFAQVDPSGESLDVIQFTACNPYACWLGACYESPNVSLLTSDILALQSQQGACAGVCGTSVSVATNSIAPMPPGSFYPASITANTDVIGGCGGQVQPALLTALGGAWELPVDGVMTLPLFIENQGDYPAQIAVTGASVTGMPSNFCALEPAEGIVYGRSAQQFVVSCDAATVAAWYAASVTNNPLQPNGDSSLSFSPGFELSYVDIARDGAAASATVELEFIIGPAVSPFIVQREVLPWWLTILLVALAVLAVVLFASVAWTTRTTNALLAAQAPPAPAPKRLAKLVHSSVSQLQLTKLLHEATHQDFPRTGVAFVDVFAVFQTPLMTNYVSAAMAMAASTMHAEVIIGVETRGFVFGALIAASLGIPFVPCRKAGKLPGRVEHVGYALEYGTAALEMAPVVGSPRLKAVVVDDVLATGGTLAAAAEVARRSGYDVVGAVVLAELASLGGASKLGDLPVSTLVRLA